MLFTSNHFMRPESCPIGHPDPIAAFSGTSQHGTPKGVRSPCHFAAINIALLTEWVNTFRGGECYEFCKRLFRLPSRKTQAKKA